MRVSLLRYPSPRPAELCPAALPADSLFQEGWGWLDWQLGAWLPRPLLPQRGEGLAWGATAGGMCAEAEAVSPEAPRLFSRLLRATQ